MYKGSTLLLQRDQQGSGADLAILVVDVLTKSETKPCDEWIDKLAKLFEIMDSSIPERESFLTNAVKWSMDSNKKGHPLLHKVILHSRVACLVSSKYRFYVTLEACKNSGTWVASEMRDPCGPSMWRCDSLEAIGCLNNLYMSLYKQ